MVPKIGPEKSGPKIGLKSPEISAVVPKIGPDNSGPKIGLKPCGCSKIWARYPGPKNRANTENISMVVQKLGLVHQAQK